MAKELDAYRNWLGITETARPLNYYQLLRLDPFEDRVAKIREHYRQMTAHVRKFADGEYAAQSRKLLGELARAMLCLTDMARKGEYDGSLGRKDVGGGKRRTFEEVLLAGKVVDRDQLEKARSFAEATGLEVRDAVLQQKMAAPKAVAAAYAESVGLACVELAEIGVDPSLASRVPPALARQHSCVPVMADAGEVLVASANPLSPDVEEQLRACFDMPVRTVLCSAAEIGEAIAKHCTGEGAAGKKKAGKKKTPKKARVAAEKESSPLSEEEQAKRRLMIAVVAFNIAVVVCMIGFVFHRGGMHLLGLMDFSLTFLVALIAGGIIFAVMTVKKL